MAATQVRPTDMSQTGTILFSSSDINNIYSSFEINTNTSSTPLEYNLSTVPSLQATEQTWELVSTEIREQVYWYATFVLNPILGIIGILGSIASVIVLKKNGLNRLSNILLLALAIADAACLFGAFHIGNLLLLIPGQGIPGRYLGFKFSYTASYVAYIVYMFSFFLSGIGNRVSTYITILITIERFIALFFPLRFHSILTPRRVWLAIAMVTLFWLPWSSFNMARRRFVYGQFFWPLFNSSVGFVFLSKYDQDGDWIDLHVITHFSQIIPLIIVTLGSIILSLKIGLTLRKRQKLTQKKSDIKHVTSHTNRTLLMVCLVFSVTRSCFYLQYLPWLSSSRGTNKDPRWLNLSHVYAILLGSLSFMNNAVNFFIYIAMNKKFRKTFKNLFGVNHSH